MTKLTPALIFFLILALTCVSPASAAATNYWNVSDFENFNETLGIAPNIGPNTVFNLSHNPHVGVIYAQDVEQVYDRPWMPIWVFVTFFFFGIGCIIASSMRRRTTTEMFLATTALAFLAMCYVTQPFIAEPGVISHPLVIYEDSNPQDTIYENLIWVQGYSRVVSIPYMPYMCQVFFWMAVLNWFFAVYNLIRYGLLRPKPMKSGMPPGGVE